MVRTAIAAAPKTRKRLTPIVTARSVPCRNALPAAFSSREWRRIFRFAGNHDFGRLDDRDGVVSAAQLEVANGVGGNHSRQRLIAYAQPHLTEKAINADLVDESMQTVAQIGRASCRE